MSAMGQDKDKPLAPVPDEERERRVEELDRELSGDEVREQQREQPPG